MNNDIIVVGGGAAGLFSALTLKQARLNVALVAPASRPDQRTTALMMPAITALKNVGVWEALRPKASPLKAMRLIDATNSLLRAPEVCFEAHELELEAFGYNIENNDLIVILEDAIEDIPRYFSPLKAMQDGLILEDNTHLQASLFVGADGKNSKLRELSGITTLKHDYPQVALTLNFSHSRPHEDCSTEFHTNEGPLTLVPLTGNRSSLVWVMNAKNAETRKALDNEALVEEIAKATQRILGRVTIESGRGFFPLSIETPKSLIAEKVALIGEAAHVLPPIGAQGLNLGLRDAAFLRDAVIKHGLDYCLEPYASSRRADILMRSVAVDGLNRSLLSPYLPLNAARATGMWALDKIPYLRQKAMQGGLAPSVLPELMMG